MTIRGLFLFLGLLFGGLPFPALAGLIGDQAPPLIVNEWVKGSPIDIKEGTNIFVVEVFDTMGTACQSAVPSLARLQEQYRSNGVVVVGISSEPIKQVQAFVERNAAKLNFRIAADKQRITTTSYMLPTDQRNVPYAFIVNTNGILVWHGPVFQGLTKELETVVSGKYNLVRAQKTDAARHQMAQYFELVSKSSSQASSVGKQILLNRTNDFDLLWDMALKIATTQNLPNRDFELASTALDQAEKLPSANPTLVMVGRAVILFESDKKDEGLALAQKAVDTAQDALSKKNAQSFLDTIKARVALQNTQATNSVSIAQQQNKIKTVFVATNAPTVPK
jgi:peroxiredoxin